MSERTQVEPTESERGAGFVHLDRATVVQIETPEHVRIGFELAGIGSRSAAVIVDFGILTMASVGLFLALAGLSQISSSDLITSTGVALAGLASFALQWGYFFLAEGFFDGRTVGKTILGLRVIGAGGTPVTPQAAALRNLVRIIDMQPIGSSVVGLGLVALHPRSQRLGDIIAGTVVVRDRGTQEIPEQQSAELTAQRPLLDHQRFEVLERYIQRRDSLPQTIRIPLGGSIAKAMGAVIANHPRRQSTPLDDLLAELYEEEVPKQSQAAGTNLQAVHLVRSQAATWNRCRELVDKAAGRGLRALDEKELAEFTGLYREVAADLARAQTYGGSLRLCFHLERLVGEAHNLFYQSRTGGFGVVEWLRTGFPRTFRRHFGFVAVAAALVFVPAFVTYAGVRSDVEFGRRLAPPMMVTRAEEAGDRLRRGEPYIDVPTVSMSVFSSQVMTNNVQVAFLAAAGGMLAGLGSVLILVFNGVSLGSVFALYHAHGAGALIWVFVLPHGILEMTAIVIAGGAGLLLGRAIVAPGRRTRARALREDGKEALALVAGAGVLLIFAGLIEGFISPARIDATLKLGFAAAVACLMVLYFVVPGADHEA
jgi:uncharacterized membrane protein SpoIIM required for sporulation/uncharacterized RDD family membrane protein YckC